MGTSASQQLSAALAALFLFLGAPALQAAVPVEESVEEPVTNGADRSQPVVRPLTRSSNSRRAPPLDIPPTIEPGVPPTIEPGDNSAAVIGVQQNQPAVSSASGGRGLADMFYQMQILQQEIQDLRGQVEEQAHTIKRLQQDQKQQYLDLDRRVASLTTGQPVTSTAQSETPSSEPTVSGAPRNERDAYRQAFEAMRAQQFAESKRAFQNLIANYPNGQYTPNAFYWIGEIFLVADQDAEQARQSFMQVVNLYPDHQKTPDAMYKLGVVHAALGENEVARRFLERVQREHPDSSAAGLARKYIAELP